MLRHSFTRLTLSTGTGTRFASTSPSSASAAATAVKRKPTTSSTTYARSSTSTTSSSKLKAPPPSASDNSLPPSLSSPSSSSTTATKPRTSSFTKSPSSAAKSVSKPAPAPSVATKAAAAVQEEEEDYHDLDFVDLRTLLPEIPPSSSSTLSAPTAAATPTLATTPQPIPITSSYPSSPSYIYTPPSTSALAPAYTPTPAPEVGREIDWTTSFHGISSNPVSEKAAGILMRPLLPNEIEIKPDGLLYLPEILYRRILHQAFGPGGWGLVPRGEMTVVKMMVSREWGLVAGGRLVSVARGEQTFFDQGGLPTATEGCKSNALMRCCKDLGIASELWDPSFIRQFKAQHCVEAWTEHVVSKKKQKRWRKKGNKFDYPLQEVKQ